MIVCVNQSKMRTTVGKILSHINKQNVGGKKISQKDLGKPSKVDQ